MNEKATMKKLILSFVILVLATASLSAQISLIGASSNQTTGNIDILRWDALDSTSVTVYPTELVAYLFGSSVFNAYSSNYYLTGFTDSVSGLFSYNTATNAQTMSSYTSFSNITEIDMSTGKIYNLRMEESDYISVNEYDIKNGTDSLLGTIYEPGIIGIVADATGFDSNNGVFYYAGYDTTSALCLYAIPVREPVFSYSKTILQSALSPGNITSVNYDNVNNTLYAMYTVYDSTWSYAGRKLVEINQGTGEVTERGDLSAFPYYLAGSSSFDQNSGSFLLVAFDSAFAQKMIIFNTYDNTYQTVFAPAASEIVCDNSDFARSAYNTTAVKLTEKPDFSLFPNPASETITISGLSTPEETRQLSILNAGGQLVKQLTLSGTDNLVLDSSMLQSGLYFVKLNSPTGSLVKKLSIL